MFYIISKIEGGGELGVRPAKHGITPDNLKTINSGPILYSTYLGFKCNEDIIDARYEFKC